MLKLSISFAIYKTNGIYPQRLRTVLDDKKELWQEINYYFKSLAK